ncbi:HAD-IIIA family hydrolase [bacterium]|nr:HAD-IIIA family hydrolase [bacterium]
MNELELRASKIKLVAFDVDGVMTDGSITYDENGIEYKTFNAKDGQGITNLKKAGIITAIITARNNGTVQHRAENLKFDEIHQGSKNKLETLNQIMQKHSFSMDEVAYMGDDLPDICILEKAGLAGCPNDAVDEVKAIAKFISTKNGGRGAVREFCDFIIKNK